MKFFSFLLLAVFLSACNNSNAPKGDSTNTTNTVDEHALLNWKDKTAANETERKQMLDAVRADVHQKGYPEFQFVVKHLQVQDGFAFFKGEAQNMDGSTYKATGEMEDCCHVEALLKKENNNWTVLSANAFSTDVWYACIWKQYKAPKSIFDYTEDCLQ